MARLLRASGFEPLAFCSAQAFLQAQAGIHPDCLILDIHMPGLSGVDLRKKIAEFTPGLPVIFITAHDEPESRQQAERAGCVAYFRKPVPGRMLLEAIARALGRWTKNNEQSPISEQDGSA